MLLTLVPPLAALVIRLLGVTWRARIANPEVESRLREGGNRVIYAFWHGGLLAPCYTHRRRAITVLISQHRDGELIARTIHRLGFRTARGSSTRGGAAGLRAMCEAAQAGSDLAMVPDGPRGPAKSVQPGVVALASLTGLPILPAGIAFSSAWRLNSWDRFAIPKPFSRIAIAFGEPIRAPAGVSEEDLDRLCQRVGEEIARAEAVAEKAVHA